MKRVDILLALIFGEVIAWFFYGFFQSLGVKIRLLHLILAISFPILSLIGVWISWFLGKKFLWIFQAAKFLLIGAMATIVDLGVLNFLIWFSGIAVGFWYLIFKGTSFIIATFAKYIGDKFWAFEKMERREIGKEFSQFFVTTLIGLVINVVVASLIVNTFGSQFNLSSKLLANIGGLVAAFGSALWSFLSYKFIVFKK